MTLIIALLKRHCMQNHLFASCLVFCLSAACAQPTLGLKGGLSLAKIVDTGHGPGSLALFHAGLSRRAQVSDAFYLQAELLYAKKGVDQSKGTINTLRLEFEYDYLSMPILGGLHLGKRFSFQFGPVLNYLLTLRSTIGTETGKGKGVLPDWEFGVLGGLDYKVNRFAIYARYELGLTRHQSFYITDINGLSLGLVEGGLNRVVQLGVGFDILCACPSPSHNSNERQNIGSALQWSYR
jgi:hypothetical protein